LSTSSSEASPEAELKKIEAGNNLTRGGERETVALLLPVALFIWESKTTMMGVPSVVKEAETIRVEREREPS
jgi:hypothetical protein